MSELNELKEMIGSVAERLDKLENEQAKENNDDQPKEVPGTNPAEEKKEVPEESTDEGKEVKQDADTGKSFQEELDEELDVEVEDKASQKSSGGGYMQKFSSNGGDEGGSSQTSASDVTPLTRSYKGKTIETGVNISTKVTVDQIVYKNLMLEVTNNFDKAIYEGVLRGFFKQNNGNGLSNRSYTLTFRVISERIVNFHSEVDPKYKKQLLEEINRGFKLMDVDFKINVQVAMQ